MKKEALQNYFILFLLVAVCILTFFILRPFIFALVLAAVVAVVFQPLHKKMLALFGDWKSLAALSTTVVIMLVILIPVFFIGLQIFREAAGLYTSLLTGDAWSNAVNSLRSAQSSLNVYFPDLQKFSIDLNEYVKQSLLYVVDHIGSIFSNLASFLVSALIFLMSLYYLLRDGKKLTSIAILVSPLTDDKDITIINKLELAINSVVKGNIIVALVQGTLSAAGFAIFGVPNPILWGTVAAVAAFIPGIGTSLVLIPSISYLFVFGTLPQALGLLLWGMLAVGLVDNYLGPRLVSKHTHLHPLLVLLSVIGGVIFFGPLGFILGPLTISLFLAVIDIYLYLMKSKSS